jgi:uncharacterized membrane protein
MLMEATFSAVIAYIELGLKIAAAFVITVAGARAFVGTVIAFFERADTGRRRRLWTDFARWLVLALEFELAADLLRTLVAPTWMDLGQLAAIAAIRTFLNYFLDKDIESAGAASTPAPVAK